LGQHFLLEPADLCFYIWEYERGAGFAANPTNSLIWNLKKRPSQVERNPCEAFHKHRAIGHAAGALRALFEREWIETQGTLVPVPCSKRAGHPDYDDRLSRVLSVAFHGYAADIRPLIEQTRNTEPDHKRAARQRFHELKNIMRVNESCARPTRPHIVVFDDVLNSGKHFKVAQAVLAHRFRDASIIGVFLARCLG
jgi:predicted amidophosphoribosyltransferase